MTEKYIYLVLSKSKTLPSKIIKYRSMANVLHRFEKDTYTHISISLDSKLTNMKSFARRSKKNFLNAGLVKENIEKGAFKNGTVTDILVLKVPVDKKAFSHLKKEIATYWKNKEKYKYNFLGTIYIFFTSYSKPSKDNSRYFCSEWVTKLLDECNIHKFDRKHTKIRPATYYLFFKDYLIYEGKPENYKNLNMITN